MNCDLPPQSGRSTVKWKTPIWGSAIIRSSDDNGINHTVFSYVKWKAYCKSINRECPPGGAYQRWLADPGCREGCLNPPQLPQGCASSINQCHHVVTLIYFQLIDDGAFVVSRTFFRQPEPDRISQRLRPVAVSRVRNISLSITTHCYSPAN